MFVAPSIANHPHLLIAFTLRFPSKIYSRFVRFQDACYTDAGVRFQQERAWIYEELLWAGTSADESTMTDLVEIDNYAPKGKEYISFMFKLRDNAYVGPSNAPLKLSTGPYKVTLRYKVLWFSRIKEFSYGEPMKYAVLPLSNYPGRLSSSLEKSTSLLAMWTNIGGALCCFSHTG